MKLLIEISRVKYYRKEMRTIIMVIINQRFSKTFLYSILCLFSLFAGVLFGGITSEASSYQSSGFYRTDFVNGIASSGPAIFNLYQGYSISANANSTLTNWKNVTQNSEVEFIHTHGANGLFELTSSVYVTGNYIQSLSFSDAPKLVYISACYTGNASSTYGEVGLQLVNKGTTAVVAFKNKISANTTTNGIHKYNSKVAVKLAYNHYTLAQSLTQAANEIYAEDGRYWGAEYRKVYGNASITF